METPFKSALFAAVERMLDESLAAVDIGRLWLHLRPQAAKKLMASEEMVDYIRSKQNSGVEIQWNTFGEIQLPTEIYGVRSFIPNTPSVRLIAEFDLHVHRIVPLAYLYWAPGPDPKEAWWMALEYTF